jgi:hypothetical protein
MRNFHNPASDAKVEQLTRSEWLVFIAGWAGAAFGLVPSMLAHWLPAPWRFTVEIGFMRFLLAYAVAMAVMTFWIAGRIHRRRSLIRPLS